MLPDNVVRIADAWWARDFACDPRELRPATTRVQAHTGDLTGNQGIWILVVGSCPVVSMPAAILPRLYEQASSWSRSTIENSAALAEELAVISHGDIIGPAFIGYAPRASLRSDAAKTVRQLNESDRAAVENLRIQCTTEEWDHGGTRFGKVPAFGAFNARGVLAAIASFETWQDNIAHISIVTARHCRGRGHGAAAVALAAEHALNSGLIPQYRTLKSNTPSMRIAQKLGFEEYGFSVYVKLANING
jgi:hypothetical protein